MTSHNWGILLALTTALISGVSIFVNKLVITGLNPYFFTGIKNALVAFLLFLVLVETNQFKNLKQLKFKQWLKLFLVGLIGGSLPFLLFFKGLSQTSAANAAFIHKNLFIFVALFSLVWLKERLSKRFLISAGLLLLGNLFLLKIFGFRRQPGDNLMMLATILWAIEIVISKKLLKELPALTVAFGRMFFGAFLIMIFLLANQQFLEVASFGLMQVQGIIITGFFLFGYVISWHQALKKAPANLVTAVLTLGSPVTSLLSLLVFGVIPDWQQSLGLVLLVLGGFFLLRQRSDYVRLKISRSL